MIASKHKRLPHYWPFVWEQDQWCGPLMFLCVSLKSEAQTYVRGELRYLGAHLTLLQWWWRLMETVAVRKHAVLNVLGQVCTYNLDWLITKCYMYQWLLSPNLIWSNLFVMCRELVCVTAIVLYLLRSFLTYAKCAALTIMGDPVNVYVFKQIRITINYIHIYWITCECI